MTKMAKKYLCAIAEEDSEMEMTPMIDVVFLLLIFFLMTFKIVSPEGDFNIKMPLARTEGRPDHETHMPPTKITLRCDDNGVLNGMLLVNRPIESRHELHLQIRDIVDDAGGPGSAGAKAMAVVRGKVDVYVHSGGQYEWDNCAPAAVAASVGLHVSRLDGSPLTYNHPDPYLPDLLICRRELAAATLTAVAG